MYGPSNSHKMFENRPVNSVLISLTTGPKGIKFIAELLDLTVEKCILGNEHCWKSILIAFSKNWKTLFRLKLDKILIETFLGFIKILHIRSFSGNFTKVLKSLIIIERVAVIEVISALHNMRQSTLEVMIVYFFGFPQQNCYGTLSHLYSRPLVCQALFNSGHQPEQNSEASARSKGTSAVISKVILSRASVLVVEALMA